MSRRSPRQARNGSAPPEAGRFAGLLRPAVLGPAAGVLAIAAVVLGILLALGVNGGSKAQDLIVNTCQQGQPGCELRTSIHVHADFALFVNGQKFNFEQPQFIAEEGQIESPYVHIHDPRFNVVHVHYSNTTWDDFFTSIKFKLTDPTLPGVTPETTCLAMPDGTKHCADGKNTFKFFVNGVQVDGIDFTNINDLDRVLVSYGPETVDQVVQQQLPQLTNEACIPSERCKAREPAGGPESEPCSASDTTCNKPGG